MTFSKQNLEDWMNKGDVFVSDLIESGAQPIAGFPDYIITKDGVIYKHIYRRMGVVRHRTKVSESASYTEANGYIACCLYSSPGVKKTLLVHRLVLETFIGACPEGQEAAHNDGVRINNSLANLRWDTPKLNSRDRIRHGTHPAGEKNAIHKLTEDQVLMLPDLIQKYGSQKRVAALLGVTPACIHAAYRGKNWKHIKALTA